MKKTSEGRRIKERVCIRGVETSYKANIKPTNMFILAIAALKEWDTKDIYHTNRY
jgi:hypothetical protein